VPARSNDVPDKGLLSTLALARGDLDRAAERRDDEAWFDGRWRDASTRVLLLHRGRAPVAGGALALLAPSAVDVGGVRVLLGVDQGTTYVALLVEADVEELDAPSGAEWAGLREVGAHLSALESELMTIAVALGHWHATHPRCPRCGAISEPAQAGWSRTCPDDASQHFPRSDPAVIVLVLDDDDRALLGRRAEWPEGNVSTLAGFVEAGESAEMTVVREMQEEAGVLVDRLDYLGSQPWPFPSSLMLGDPARLAPGSPQPRPDATEIVEVRWFTREEMREGCEAGGRGPGATEPGSPGGRGTRSARAGRS
jgi:NAD+ diphosphatase